jgi:hypothetical protein
MAGVVHIIMKGDTYVAAARVESNTHTMLFVLRKLVPLTYTVIPPVDEPRVGDTEKRWGLSADPADSNTSKLSMAKKFPPAVPEYNKRNRVDLVIAACGMTSSKKVHPVVVLLTPVPTKWNSFISVYVLPPSTEYPRTALWPASISPQVLFPASR